MAENTVTSELSKIPYSFDHLLDAFLVVNHALALNPLGILLNLMLIAGVLAFTDTSFGKGRWNWIAGVLHGVAHMINLYVLLWLFSRIDYLLLNGEWFGETYMRMHELGIASLFYTLLFIFEMMIIGGISAGFIFGVYLLISILVFHSHPTESFSSFRGTGYKNFLRLHITSAGVTIYPMGVRNVVTHWKQKGTKDKPVFEGGPVEYELIEPPIHIKFNSHETFVKSTEHIKTRI